MAFKTDWLFRELDPLDKQRDPAWAEFFDSAQSIRGHSDALIREAFQNSLDQTLQNSDPLRMCIRLSGDVEALDPEIARKYFESLWPHLRGLPKEKDSPKLDDSCRFLVVEDFNTGGLIGDPDQHTRPSLEDRNDFYYFFRADGQSGKLGQQRGRWGIGKYVFPMSSHIYTFFGLTVRESNEDGGYDQGAGLLMGAAVLNNHEVLETGVQYLPDGWWGLRQSPRHPVTPFTDPSNLQEFRKHWGITRKDEPGLSIVIPYLAESWELADLVQSILQDYFLAVAQGKLVVDLDDMSTKESIRIDADTLEALIDSHITELTEKTRLLEDIDLIKWASTQIPLKLSMPLDRSPSWQAEPDPSEVSAIKDAFDDDGRVVLEIPMRVKRSDGSFDEKGHLKLLMAQTDEGPFEPTFIRNSIRVSQAATYKLNKVRSLVLIGDDSLAQMLGDAEGPAHVDWSEKTHMASGLNIRMPQPPLSSFEALHSKFYVGFVA